jgi:hypothetical protein
MLDAHAWMRQRGARMTEMYTYESWSIDTGDYVPSGRYGTREAILERFGNSRIVDAAPVEVESADFCPDWKGFARKGCRP